MAGPDPQTTMAGLIPLTLIKPAHGPVASVSPFTSSSFSAPPPLPSPSFFPLRSVMSSHRYSILSTRSAPAASTHRRRSSSRMSTASCESSESTAAFAVPPRRLSVPTVPTLPGLPSTPAEWTRAMAEIKRHFANRRFRQCAARCSDMLGPCDGVVVETAYLIFLHFYAAASLEQTIRPLHSASPARVRLLREVRDHYARADELARDEDDSVSRASRRSSADSCSMQSVSSRATTVSAATTAVSSPIQSGFPLSSCRPAAPGKKRVTFSDSGAPVAAAAAAAASGEPVVRPDSPTLGFDDGFRRRFPDRTANGAAPETVSHTPEPASERGGDGGEDASPDMQDIFLSPRPNPFVRYTTVLGDLRVQIVTHISSVDAQLAMAAAPSSCISDVTADRDEMRSLELRARIERLRAGGWNRPRFDAKRYEALREIALAELA